MKKVKLINTFHNTEAVVMVSDTCKDAWDAWDEVQGLAHHESPGVYREKRRLRSVEKKLCPSYPDCACGSFRPN